jgi:hypothetical protein
MFICLECGNVFEDAKDYEERHPYGEGYASEHFSCCPYCGGDYEDAISCDECGEYFPSEELVDGWCPHCISEYMDDCENKIVDIIHSQISKEDFDRLPEEFIDNVWDKLCNKYYPKKEK